jgi:hypothetical protein
MLRNGVSFGDRVIEKSVVNDDVFVLSKLGGVLDWRWHGLQRKTEEEKKNPYLVAPTMRDWLIANQVKIRDKDRNLVLLDVNRAQAEYAKRCTGRNIVLKARQMGITTYVAARFFVQTITRPGTLTVQVAHNQESAEEIFRIVHRFWENLPEAVRHGVLLTSHANIRRIVFPWLDSEYRVATAADENAGRGLTIHNLHCSEVARWPRQGSETLAALRMAVPSTGEIVLEGKFKEGLGKIIDGTVECLNASLWAKKQA